MFRLFLQMAHVIICYLSLFVSSYPSLSTNDWQWNWNKNVHLEGKNSWKVCCQHLERLPTLEKTWIMMLLPLNTDFCRMLIKWVQYICSWSFNFKIFYFKIFSSSLSQKNTFDETSGRTPRVCANLSLFRARSPERFRSVAPGRGWSSLRSALTVPAFRFPRL